jgi:hypothetical protein
VQRERELEEHEGDLLPLPATFEDRHQLAVMLDRLIERVLQAGVVARACEVDHGLVVIVRGQPVVGQQPGNLVLTAGVRLLEPRSRLAVQADTLLGYQRSIRSLLDERVLEPELRFGPAAALADQIEPLEMGERGPDVDAVAGNGLEQRQAELPSEHRRRQQRRTRPGFEPIDARHDHLLDGGRHLDVHLMVEPPTFAGSYERPGVG